jgi:hypothetical protein
MQTPAAARAGWRFGSAQLKRASLRFRKLPRGDKRRRCRSFAFNSSHDVTVVNCRRTTFRVSTPPSMTSPDIYPMYVASSLLRDRVFEEVRVKRNMSYAPDAFLRTQA